MAKYFEGELWVQYDELTEERAKYRRLMDTNDNQNAELFNLNAEIENLYRWIKSDSIYTLLRHGSKSTTIIDGMDEHYIDMLNLSEKLRMLDTEDINTRNDAFDQKLP